MKELDRFFKHCFAEAEKVSKERGLKLSKGIMDIPGLADDKGRAPFAEFPVIEPDDSVNKFRMFFTYEEDTSSDLDGKNFGGVNHLYQTPWLRVVFPIVNSENSVFFRISKRKKDISGKFKHIFNFVPGKKLSVPADLENFYYLFAPDRQREITDKIYVSGIIERLEHFDNLIMIHLDSRSFIADIKCDRDELYSEDLIITYTRDLQELREQFVIKEL